MEILLHSCTDALLAECVSSDDPAPREASHARVVWLDPTSVRIELVQSSTAPAEEPRFMIFRPTDPERERWQSIGLVVAALALHRDEAAAPTPAADAGVESTPSAPQPSPVESRTLPAWIGLGAELGSALDSGGPRIGARLELGLRPAPVEPLLATLTAGVARRSMDDVGLSAPFAQVGVAIGAGATLSALQLDLRVHAGPILEGVTVAVEEADGATRDATRWLAGGRVGLAAAWPSAGPVAGFLAVSGWHLSGATGVRVGGDWVATVPAAGASGQAGVEIRLDP
jgi:hypothetical protein